MTLHLGVLRRRRQLTEHRRGENRWSWERAVGNGRTWGTGALLSRDLSAAVFRSVAQNVYVWIHAAGHDQQPGSVDGAGAGPRGESGPDLDDGPARTRTSASNRRSEVTTVPPLMRIP